MNRFIVASLLMLLIECNSISHLSSEIVCGKWQLYAADTGRNGKEQKQPIIYIFMPDGIYVYYLDESTPETGTGKWEIKDGKLLLSDTKNNIAAYTYRCEQGHTFIHTAYGEKFFPKGVTFILRKQ